VVFGVHLSAGASFRPDRKSPTICPYLQLPTFGSIDAKEDYENHFAIKTMKTELRIQDFNSYWEKGKRPNSNKCEEICSLKGISLSIFNDETKDAVLDIFRSLFPLAPKYKPFLSAVKFYDQSGLVKSTKDFINKLETSIH